ncbi:MAG TPA: universal stress protein [Candidatus Binatia bacterium]|jgi:nucleotide-binding universal stress UspA family protein
MSNVQKILVPIDFSERSFHGLEYAASLARATGAELIVCHIFEREDRHAFPESYTVIEGWPALKTEGTPMERLLRNKSARLDRWIVRAIVEPHMLKIKKRVEVGESIAEIVRVANEESVNLIVLAIRKKSVFSYLIARSPFLKKSWRFPCPVVVTPATSRPATVPIPEEMESP